MSEKKVKIVTLNVYKISGKQYPANSIIEVSEKEAKRLMFMRRPAARLAGELELAKPLTKAVVKKNKVVETPKDPETSGKDEEGTPIGELTVAQLKEQIDRYGEDLYSSSDNKAELIAILTGLLEGQS